jgi:hypothetical protein
MLVPRLNRDWLQEYSANCIANWTFEDFQIIMQKAHSDSVFACMVMYDRHEISKIGLQGLIARAAGQGMYINKPII